jgi:hypothetical protein
MKRFVLQMLELAILIAIVKYTAVFWKEDSFRTSLIIFPYILLRHYIVANARPDWKQMRIRDTF